MKHLFVGKIKSYFGSFDIIYNFGSSLKWKNKEYFRDEKLQALFKICLKLNSLNFYCTVTFEICLPLIKKEGTTSAFKHAFENREMPYFGENKMFSLSSLKEKKIYSFAATNRKVSFWVDLKRKCFPLSNFFWFLKDRPAICMSKLHL